MTKWCNGDVLFSLHEIAKQARERQRYTKGILISTGCTPPLYWYAEILRPHHVVQVNKNDISTSHDIAWKTNLNVFVKSVDKGESGSLI